MAKLNMVRRATNMMAQDRGRQAENIYATSQKAIGNSVRRTGRGSDFAVTATDCWGRPVGKTKLVEVKTGKAKTSRLQKATKKKNPKNYEVVRFW